MIKLYYPVLLDVEDKPCLIVGGGKVALRKAKKLVEYGARIEIVSPEVIKPLQALLKPEQIKLDFYKEDYCQNKFIIIAATDDTGLNFKICQDARKAGALVNVVDRIELCDFILPAVYREGELQIAVSTGGNSPALARKIREMLQNEFRGDYKRRLDLLGSIRKLIKAEVDNGEKRKEIFSKLAELIQKGDE